MVDATRPRSGLVHERCGGPTEWYTPPSVFDALGLDFDLDPCSPGADVVPWIPARNHYTRVDDGLVQPWRGRVWLNPPYGPGIGRWLDRLAEHHDGIALVFARTNTCWFHTYAARADAVCFTRGRIPFMPPARTDVPLGTPGCGSLLLAYGSPCVAALRHSGLGWVVARSWRQPGRHFGSTRALRRVAHRFHAVSAEVR